MTKNQIKNYLLLPYDFIMLFFYIVAFKLLKTNFKNSSHTLIRLFCLTGGLSNDLVSFLTKKELKNINLETKIKKDNFDLINRSLNEEGYFIVENFLSENNCDNLKKFILDSKLITKKNKSFNNEILFKPENPEGVFYEMSKNKIFDSEIAQDLVFSRFINNVCKNYFKSLPFFDHISLAISAKSNKPDSDAAQLFHFDLDRPKWLKFFIYLNDVNDDNGPHYFIPKTHKNFGIKNEIRRNGYSRISDSEIKNYYSDIKKIIGKKGTLIIEDTRGLHKGSVVKKNYRCIAVLQFNNSNFGAENSNYKFQIKNEKNNRFFLDNNETFSNITKITNS
jgi:hypothetical protein